MLLEKLREDQQVQMAVGVIAASHGIGVADARDKLREAAHRAGVSEAALAECIIEIDDRHDPE